MNREEYIQIGNNNRPHLTDYAHSHMIECCIKHRFLRYDYQTGVLHDSEPITKSRLRFGKIILWHTATTDLYKKITAYNVMNTARHHVSSYFFACCHEKRLCDEATDLNHVRKEGEA